MRSQFQRLSETDRDTVNFFIDGQPVTGLAGDTILAALLNVTQNVRYSEFDDIPRGGFCLMGACQDCWVRTEDGRSVRACTTPLEDGMRFVIESGSGEWLSNGS